MQFGWSVLEQKLPQWTLKAISDQLISDHCVVGFRPEAHPMGPEKTFPTNSFPTTVWSVIDQKLIQWALKRHFRPTNFRPQCGRFYNWAPQLSPELLYRPTHFRPSLVGFEAIHVYDTSTVGQIYLIQSTCIWTWKHISDRQNRSVL